ncbi:MAG: DUF1499 domain-containing protein [Longimicrobiales bacterium]
MILDRIRQALTRNRVETHPLHQDPGLRGRTYAIPFSRVWKEAEAMASGDLRGWEILEADEDRGLIRAEATTSVFRFVDDVEIRLSLDENGQTRVDMTSGSRVGKGDLGKNARRVRSFFRALDRRIGPEAGQILDPTIPIRRGLGLLLVLLAGCTGGQDAVPPGGEAESQAPAPERNFQGRSYERDIVFLTTRGDSSLVAVWSFTARTRPQAVDRSLRGWLARSDTWDPFFSEAWESPPSRVPWRILPRGPARIIVGRGDALERIYFEEGPKRLEVALGSLLVEWTGPRAQTFRIHEGITILSSGQVPGVVLDLARAWTLNDPPPGDWAFLVSGDSLQLVLEDQEGSSGPQGGAYSGWARVGFSDRQWQGIRLSWSETRAFEPSRRDVPMGWRIHSPAGIEGVLTPVAPFLEAGEGDGPVLPVDALYQVSGTFSLDGRDFPVQGMFRHTRR